MKFLKSGAFLFIVTMIIIRGFQVKTSTAFRRITSRALSSQTPSVVKSLNVKDFGQILNGQNRELFQIIDVRESHELEIAKLKDANVIHLPLSLASEWSTKIENGELLDKTMPTAVLCKVGMR